MASLFCKLWWGRFDVMIVCAREKWDKGEQCILLMRKKILALALLYCYIEKVVHLHNVVISCVNIFFFLKSSNLVWVLVTGSSTYNSVASMAPVGLKKVFKSQFPCICHYESGPIIQDEIFFVPLILVLDDGLLGTLINPFRRRYPFFLLLHAWVACLNIYKLQSLLKMISVLLKRSNAKSDHFLETLWLQIIIE